MEGDEAVVMVVFMRGGRYTRGVVAREESKEERRLAQAHSGLI
jgi:hypothetical protein